MTSQQWSLTWRHLTHLMGVLMLAVLLSGLSLAGSSVKSIDDPAESRLVSHLNSLANLYENHFRVSLADETLAVDPISKTDNPFWGILLLAIGLLFSYYGFITVIFRRDNLIFRRYHDYFSPLLRAPPQAN